MSQRGSLQPVSCVARMPQRGSTQTRSARRDVLSGHGQYYCCSTARRVLEEPLLMRIIKHANRWLRATRHAVDPGIHLQDINTCRARARAHRLLSPEHTDARAPLAILGLSVAMMIMLHQHELDKTTAHVRINNGHIVPLCSGASTVRCREALAPDAAGDSHVCLAHSHGPICRAVPFFGDCCSGSSAHHTDYSSQLVAPLWCRRTHAHAISCSFRTRVVVLMQQFDFISCVPISTIISGLTLDAPMQEQIVGASIPMLEPTARAYC